MGAAITKVMKQAGAKNRNRDCGEKGHNQRRWRKKRHSKCARKIERTPTVYAGRSDGRMGDRRGFGWKRIWDKCPESDGRGQGVSSETGRHLPEVFGGLSDLSWASPKTYSFQTCTSPAISIPLQDFRRLERRKTGKIARK